MGGRIIPGGVTPKGLDEMRTLRERVAALEAALKRANQYSDQLERRAALAESAARTAYRSIVWGK